MAVFRTYKPDGSLQFDAGLMTMALIGQGTVFTQDRVSGLSTPSSALVPLPDLTTPIIVAVQSGFSSARAGRYMNGSQPVAHFATNAGVGQPLRYWLFGQSNRFPPNNFGLNLFDTAGNLTYSSSRPIATVATVLTGVGQTVSLPTDRVYAMAAQEWTGHSRNNGRLYRNGVIWEPGDGGTNVSAEWSYGSDYKLYGCGVNGGTVGTGTVSFSDVRRSMGQSRTPPKPNPTDFWERPMGTTLVLDVTGL